MAGRKPMSWRGIGAMGAALALVLLACRTSEEMSFVKVRPDVVEAVRSGIPTPVVIGLNPPNGYGEEGTDPTVFRPQIAQAQDAVLAALDPAHYRNRIRYDAIPAMAGTILDPAALRVLERQPEVASVALDLDGVGH